MEDPNELVDKPEEILPNPEAVVPKALKKAEVLFLGLVENGYFKPVPDKLHTPPRWEQGTYSLAAGKWPSPALTTADLLDLTSYNGYALLVLASEWNKEVISQARIVGVLDNTAHDIISKFAYLTLQEKEEEIAVYLSGIGN